MKKLFLALVLASTFSALPLWSQNKSQNDNITIAAYVPNDGSLTTKECEVLTTMLNRMMTSYGCAGGGFDNRFIIMPKVQNSRHEVAGLESKHVVEVDLNLFIGDGANGTLFSSTGCTLRGIGNTPEEARVAAFRKSPTRSPALKEFVEVGKQRITEYYENQGPAIINTAQGLAAKHNYEEAISVLFVIPSTCSHYQQAQKLIGEYGLAYGNAQNDAAISEAQAAWTADPTSEGAAAATAALNKVTYPTSAQQAKIKSLLDQIDKKFENREKRQHELELLDKKNSHEEVMARISSDEKVQRAQYAAAAKVAQAYYSSRPYSYVLWY